MKRVCLYHCSCRYSLRAIVLKHIRFILHHLTYRYNANKIYKTTHDCGLLIILPLRHPDLLFLLLQISRIRLRQIKRRREVRLLPAPTDQPLLLVVAARQPLTRITEQSWQLWLRIKAATYRTISATSNCIVCNSIWTKSIYFKFQGHWSSHLFNLSALLFNENV